MQKLTKVSKIILIINVLFLALWLGGYVARHFVMYQLFDPETQLLRTNYQISSLPNVLITILPLFVYNIITYTVFIVTFILFLFFSKIKLKYEGWLFIIMLIVFICAPFEIFLLLKDYKIAVIINSGSFNPKDVVELIKERIEILNSFSLVEIFSYIGIIALAVFRPLRKKYEN